MTDEAFFRGYGIGIKELEKPDRSEKMKLYRMYYCLVEAYVGIGEYNNTEQYENGKEHALKRARQIIDGR